MADTPPPPGDNPPPPGDNPPPPGDNPPPPEDTPSTLSPECKEIADEQTKRLRNIEKVLVSIAVSVLGLTLDELDLDRKSTRLNSSHSAKSRMPSSA